MSQPSILIVEDDEPLAAVIADFLRQNGFAVSIEGRGDRARARIVAESAQPRRARPDAPGARAATRCAAACAPTTAVRS